MNLRVTRDERSLSTDHEQVEPADGDSYVICASGRFVLLPDRRRVDLRRQRLLQILLSRLVNGWVEHAGGPVATHRLIEAMWPDERLNEASAKNRLRVAVAKLRTNGLADLLIGVRGGYLLDPDARITVAA